MELADIKPPEQSMPQQTTELHGLPRERTRRVISDDEDDDLPLRDRLAVRQPQKVSSSNTLPAHKDRPQLRQTTITTPKTSHKKPGPKPYASKPVMKNDMVAKMEVIREIESHWGKGFIRAYIPKCHRPLMKKGNKRCYTREHETDPKKWLPSVLKAVLMIARLTKDKVWLKKAMLEVVRYRIKHTGNRKPQLVTTDFDVIEDMLTRGWACAVSFEVRYKHLLMAQPKDERPQDEDIDHILSQGGSGSDQDSEDEGLGKDSDEEMVGIDDDEEDFSSYTQGQGFPNAYGQQSGYINSAPHMPPKMVMSPPVPKQAKVSSKRPGSAKQPPQSPHPQMYGYGPYGPFPGYGPQMNPYGQQMPGFPPHMKGYPPPHMYSGYGPYAGYGQQDPGKDPRNAGHQGQGYQSMNPYWPQPPMIPSPSMNNGNGGSNQQKMRFSPFGSSKRGSRGPAHDDAYPSYEMGMGPEATGERSSLQPSSTNPRIKREPGMEDRPISIDDFDAPSNYLGGAQSEESGEEPNADTEDTILLELQEAEAQHKLLQLKKKLAIAQAKKNQ
jgi:hypothetical protein